MFVKLPPFRLVPHEYNQHFNSCSAQGDNITASHVDKKEEHTQPYDNREIHSNSNSARLGHRMYVLFAVTGHVPVQRYRFLLLIHSSGETKYYFRAGACW